MSGFVDFVVATPEEAPTFAESNDPERIWPPCISAKFIHEVDLCALWALLPESTPPEAFKTLASKGLWMVYSLPDSFVELLAKIRSEDVTDHVQQWHQRISAPSLHSQSSLAELLNGLSHLAKLAKGDRTVLFRESQG